MCIFYFFFHFWTYYSYIYGSPFIFMILYKDITAVNTYVVQYIHNQLKSFVSILHLKILVSQSVSKTSTIQMFSGNIGIFWVTNHFQYTIRIYLNCTYGKSTWIYCYSDVSNTLTIHKEKTLSLRPSVLEIKCQQTCILFRRNSLRTMKQICLQIHIHEHVPEQSRYRYTYKMISCTHVLP